MHWSVGVGILCLLGMVFVYFNANKEPMTVLSQSSDEVLTGSSVRRSVDNEVISHSQKSLTGNHTHVPEPLIADVIFAGEGNIEIGEPLVNDDANKPVVSIGDFIDDDSDWVEVSDTPPIIIGTFIDVDSDWVEVSDTPPIIIGTFIDVDSDWAEVSDKPSDKVPIIIGEFIDIEDFVSEDNSKALSIGEYIPVEP